MSIQRLKAESLKLEFCAVYENICEHEDEGFSPWITSDRERIMQVLLGLQSNALKFT
jgi:signal transduction histidine kinase